MQVFPKEQTGRGGHGRVAIRECRDAVPREEGNTMSMTHSAIAQIFTDRLGPEEFHEEENSVDRGHRIEMEAMSLTRILGRLAWWRRDTAAADPQAELQAAVKRLAELSPHLLIDVGIDPATGRVAEDGVALVLARPVQSVEQLPQVVADPAPAVRPARPMRLRLQVTVLPADAGSAKLAPG